MQHHNSFSVLPSFFLVELMLLQGGCITNFQEAAGRWVSGNYGSSHVLGQVVELHELMLPNKRRFVVGSSQLL